MRFGSNVNTVKTANTVKTLEYYINGGFQAMDIATYIAIAMKEHATSSSLKSLISADRLIFALRNPGIFPCPEEYIAPRDLPDMPYGLAIMLLIDVFNNLLRGQMNGVYERIQKRVRTVQDAIMGMPCNNSGFNDQLKDLVKCARAIFSREIEGSTDCILFMVVEGHLVFKPDFSIMARKFKDRLKTSVDALPDNKKIGMAKIYEVYMAMEQEDLESLIDSAMIEVVSDAFKAEVMQHVVAVSFARLIDEKASVKRRDVEVANEVTEVTKELTEEVTDMEDVQVADKFVDLFSAMQT
jgi:hypothetical protein